MRMRFFVQTVLATTLVCGTPGRCLTAVTLDAHGGSTTDDDPQGLVGTWLGGTGDGGGGYVVQLELRADGTYKKTLTAKTNNPNGSHSGYGGTHSGTWKAKGSVVFLSGDGNWPPYSHDLSGFRKAH